MWTHMKIASVFFVLLSTHFHISKWAFCNALRSLSSVHRESFLEKLMYFCKRSKTWLGSKQRYQTIYRVMVILVAVYVLEGGTVVQWSAIAPQSKKALGSNQTDGCIRQACFRVFLPSGGQKCSNAALRSHSSAAFLFTHFVVCKENF